MTRRAVTYARVSGDDRAKEDRNLRSQLEMYREYCQDKGYQIVAELAEDDRGASGADWDLPQLNKALEMARAGKFDVLVTRELDRFARGLAKQLVVEAEFKRYGVDVEYVLEQYDDTPEGQLTKNIRAVIAEFEREKINQRMTRGRRNIVKAGGVMLHGQTAPYGYRAQNRELIIYEPEARIVRLIYQWYTQGDETDKRPGIRAIAKKLNEMRVPTRGRARKRDKDKWLHVAVAEVLSNEVYAGVWHYGKKGNDRDQWLAVEVPAIVDRELWEMAQKRKKRNSRMSRRNTKNQYLVGRRVLCGQCGNKMHGRPVTSGGKRYLYYFCPAKMGEVAACQCDAPFFRADHVDTAIWAWMKEILMHPETLWAKLERKQAELKEAMHYFYDRVKVIDDLLDKNRKQLERALDLYLSGSFDKEMLVERKNRLETTIKALERERAVLTWEAHERILTDEQIKSIEDMAGKVGRELEAAGADFDSRRQLIEALDVRVTLAVEDGQRVAHVRCRIGEEVVLPVESDRSCAILPQILAKVLFATFARLAVLF